MLIEVSRAKEFLVKYSGQIQSSSDFFNKAFGAFARICTFVEYLISSVYFESVRGGDI